MGRHIITTAVEHNAVLEPCKWYQSQGWEVTYLVPDHAGNITAEQVAQALRPDTALISVMLVNNETGCVFFRRRDRAAAPRPRQPGSAAHRRRAGLYEGFLLSKDLGVDLLSLSAHKIGGPKGIGALYISPRVAHPRPLLPGGGQEKGLRSGTGSHPSNCGLCQGRGAAGRKPF